MRLSKSRGRSANDRSMARGVGGAGGTTQREGEQPTAASNYVVREHTFLRISCRSIGTLLPCRTQYVQQHGTHSTIICTRLETDIPGLNAGSLPDRRLSCLEFGSSGTQHTQQGTFASVSKTTPSMTAGEGIRKWKHVSYESYTFALTLF